MADINKDSVKASKPQSDKDVNMSSASKAFGAETLEAPTAGGGMVARDDAYCFVYKKCMDSGVTLGHYRIILGEMQENVNMRYATNDDEEWKKWKVQSMVWDYFFHGQAFPAPVPPYPTPEGRLSRDTTPPVQASSGSRGPELERSARSTNHGMTETSMARIMRDKAKNLGLDMRVFDAAVQEKRQIAENRFPSESDEWREWFGESLVWGSFFKGAPFPVLEPARLYPLRSSVNIQQHQARSGGKWIKTPLLSDRAPMEYSNPVRVTSHLGIPTGPSVAVGHTSVVTTQLPTPVLYHGLEPLMEKKARALGVRREFFQCLQRNRDLARSQHPKCDQQFRAWLADKLTWNFIFKGEQFPGKEPIAVDLHDSSCVAGTLKRLPNVHETRNISCSIIYIEDTMAFSRPFPRPVFDEICWKLNDSTGLKDIAVVERALQCHFTLKNAGTEGLCRRICIEAYSKVNLKEVPSVVKQGFNFIQSWIDWIRKALTIFQQSTSDLTKFDRNYFSLAEYWSKYNHSSRKIVKHGSSESTTRSGPREISSSLSHGSLSRERPAQSNSSVMKQADQPEDRERLIVYGTYKVLINCTDRVIKDLAYALLIDQQKILVEESLHCQITALERKRNRGDGLTIQVSPVDNIGVAYFKDATDFVNAWVRQGRRGQVSKISSFWSARADPKKNISGEDLGGNSRVMVDSSSQTEQSAAPDMKFMIALGDPEQDWEKYSAKFGATEVDRVLLEEQVKAEGSLRLVLDQDTQDIVSLGEFEERTLLRWITAKNATTTETNAPMKVEHGGSGSGQVTTDRKLQLDDEMEEGEVPTSPRHATTTARYSTRMHGPEYVVGLTKDKRKAESDDGEMEDRLEKRARM